MGTSFTNEPGEDRNHFYTFDAISPRWTAKYTTRESILRWALVGAISAVAGLQLIHLLTWTPYQLVIHGIFIDDAFFYSVLARNLYRFGFLTLDGEMPTNGVQPLWMLVQLILAGLFPKVNGVTLLSWSSWVCYVLFCFLCTWFITGRRRSLYTMTLAAVIMGGLMLLNVRFQQLVVKGLETPLMLVVLLLTLLIIDHIGSTHRASGWSVWKVSGLALASTLCFFARTDLFWINLALGGWLLVTHRKRRRPLLIYFSLVSLLVLPYLAFNYLTQGSIVPISGRVKLFYISTFYSRWSDYLASEEWQGIFCAATNTFLLECQLSTITIAVTFAIIAAWQWLVWKNRSIFPLSVQLLSLAMMAHMTYMQFIYRELRPYSAYYFVPELFWSVTVLTLYVTRRHKDSLDGQAFNAPGKFLVGWRHKSLPLVVAFMSVWLMGIRWSNHTLQPEPYWVERMHLVSDIQRILPHSDRISAFWPGTFAQFSGKLVTPLDGIVGSNDFFNNYVKPGRQLSYILERSRPNLIVFLPQSPDHLYTKSRPNVDPWQIGTIRLWEHGEASTRILAARTLNPKGPGWYLVELKSTLCCENQ